jgi:hypothetical protein
MLPPACLPYSPEYRPEPPDRGPAALAAVAAATGGRERIDVGDIWRELPPSTRWIELTPWLALAAAAVFLLEIFQRRTGLLSIRTAPAAEAGPKRQRRARARAAPPAGPAPAAPAEAPVAKPEPTAHPPPADDLQSALRQARRTAERRMKKDD